jgi:hypothetical protein
MSRNVAQVYTGTIATMWTGPGLAYSDGAAEIVLTANRGK